MSVMQPLPTITFQFSRYQSDGSIFLDFGLDLIVKTSSEFVILFFSISPKYSEPEVVVGMPPHQDDSVASENNAVDFERTSLAAH